MNPLDAFWKGSDEVDEFPTLNPSRGSMGASSTPAISQPQATAQPTSQPKSSFLSKAKDVGIGVLKGLGQTALDTAKLVVGGVNPVGINSPLAKRGENPADKLLNQADPFLEPSNPLQQKAKGTEQIAELLIPFFGVVAKGVTKMPAIARSLEEVSMRLTPTEKMNLGGKLELAKNWMVKNSVTGSPDKRLAVVDEAYNTFEAKLSQFLKTNNTAKGFYVPKSAVIKDFEGVKNLFRNDRDFLTIEKQVDDAIAGVKAIFKREKIPVDRFNDFKRSVFSRAFNRAGTKVLDDVEFALGGKADTALQRALRGVPIDDVPLDLFNKEYSAIITSRKILQKAAERGELGNWGRFITSMLGMGAGSVIGGGFAGPVIGGAVGTYLAPTLAGTAVRSNIGNVAELIGKLSPAAKKSLSTLLLGSVPVSTSRLERILSGGDESPLEEDVPAPQKELTPQERQSLDSFMH